MQNTLMGRAELRFWQVLNPLLRRTVSLKTLWGRLVNTLRTGVDRLTDLLEGRYANVYLLLCVLCALAALTGGYALATFLSR